MNLPFLNRTALTLATFFAAIFSVWALAFWPGVVTQDSFRSLEQIQEWRFYNLHPYIYTLYLAFFKVFSGSLGLVVVFQILATSLLGGILFSHILAHTNHRKVTLVSILLFAFSPAVGAMNLAIWKDIPYSILVVAWAMFAALAPRAGWKIKSTLEIIALGLILSFTGLVRHNGVILIGVVPLAFWWVRLVDLRRGALLLLSTLFFYLIAQYPLASYLHVDMHLAYYKRMQRLQPMGALLADETTDLSVLTPEETAVVESILPREFAKSKFNCLDSNSWILDIAEIAKLLREDDAYRKFNSAFYKLIANNPQALANERLCFLWSVFSSQGFIFTNEMENKNEWVISVRERLGLKISPVHEGLHHLLSNFLFLSTSTKLRLIVWNLWLPLIIALFGLVGGFRGDRGLFAASIIVLINLPALMLVAMAADWRYFYSLHLAAYFLAPLVLRPTRSA